MVEFILASCIIAYPSEKGGYNAFTNSILSLTIIAYPSEKGGYNFLLLPLKLSQFILFIINPFKK